MGFWSELFEPVKQKQRTRWEIEGKRRGANFVIFEYDSPARVVYPVCDKLSRTVEEALKKMLAKQQKYFVGMVDLREKPAEK